MLNLVATYNVTSSTARVFEADKRLLLLAWLALHGCGVCLMFYLPTSLNIEYTAVGFKATSMLVALCGLNTFLYGRLYHVKHAADASQGAEYSSCGDSPSIPMWSTLSPAWAHRLEPACTASTDHEVLPLTASDTNGRQCKMCNSSQASVRTHHCRDCSICVQGFDHHCYWLGTCIGDSNHGLFWCYLLSESALCLYALHQGLTAWRHAAHLDVWDLQQWSAVAYTAVVWLLSLVIGGLLVFHTILISSNWKTYELLKGHMLPYLHGRAVGTRSPFDRGPARNLYNFVLHRQVYNTLVYKASTDTRTGFVAALWENSWYSCC